MKHIRTRATALLLSLLLALSLAVPAWAADTEAVDAAMSDTAAYLCRLVQSP